jgi:hypothetical protein
MKAFLRNNLFAILAVLVVLFASLTAYFFQQSRKAGSENETQAETRALVRKVGNLIVLPDDEIPTIATVSDPEALKGQAFFDGAKKGYKVLIYTNAKKAILFDPASGKIVNVAPLTMNATSTTPTSL